MSSPSSSKAVILISTEVSFEEMDAHKRQFVLYTVKTVAGSAIEFNGRTECTTHAVKRRFKDFVKLFHCLSKEYPMHVLPRLPEKSLLSGLFRFNEKFIEKRRRGLQDFITGIHIHPILNKSSEFRDFLLVDGVVAAVVSEEAGIHENSDMDSSIITDRSSMGLGQFAGLAEEELHAKLRALKPELLSSLKTMYVVANLFHKKGRYDEAKSLYEQVVTGYEQEYGEHHKKTICAIEHLAILLMDIGETDRAKELFLRALESKEISHVFGPHHLSTLRTACIVANIIQDSNKHLDEAKVLYERVLDGYSEKYPPGHAELCQLLLSYGILLQTLGIMDKAEDTIESASKGLLKLFGANHMSTLTAFDHLAEIYTDMRRLDEALVLFEEVLRTKEDVLEENHASTLKTIGSIAMVYQLMGNEEKAAYYYDRYRKAVELDMKAEVLDIHESGTAVTASSSSASTSLNLDDSPDLSTYDKYVKMHKVGIPKHVVKEKIKLDGFNPDILDDLISDKEKVIAGGEEELSTENLEGALSAVKLSEHPKLVVYFKMQKAGVPKEAISKKMSLEGVDPSFINRDPNELVQPNFDVGVQEQIKLHEHPQLTGFFKMIKIGLPVKTVAFKMQTEGIDGSYIERDPNELVPATLNVAMKTASSVKQTKSSVHKKRLHWKSIDKSKLLNTLWAEQDDDGIYVDEDEFNRLFIKHDDDKTSDTNRSKLTVARKHRVNLIDLKRGQNAGIGLATIKLSFQEMKDCVLCLDDSILLTEQLKSLDEALPTQDECKIISSYKGDFELLGRAEQYMTYMLDLPKASERIQCMVFKQQFSSRVRDVRLQASKVEKACDDLKLSGRFKKVLKTILKIGNQLNEGMPDQAGFTVDSLLKLQNAKAFDKKTSILHYLVTLLQRNDPSLLYFTEDLGSVTEASRITMESIVGELCQLRKCLQECVNILSSVHEISVKCADDEISTSILNGVRRMRSFHIQAASVLDDIGSFFDTVKTKFSGILSYFGEEPTMHSHEFFTTLSKFLKEFILTRSIVERTVREDSKATSPSSPSAVRAKSRRATLAITSTQIYQEDLKHAPRASEAELLRMSDINRGSIVSAVGVGGRCDEEQDDLRNITEDDQDPPKKDNTTSISVQPKRRASVL